MKIYCRGKAIIRHADTDGIFEIDYTELDWDIIDVNERSMGAETHYEATINHPELGAIVWGLWEYPEGAQNDSNSNVGEHEIVEDFDYGLEHEQPELDGWFNYEIPSNPYSIFINSYYHTGDLLADHGGVSGESLLNRMIFSHQVTALEAYLGDTLINEVMGDKDAMYNLIAKADELKDEKFTLADIANSPDLVQSTVRKYLRTILYHNLTKVDVLYNIALGIRILNLSKDKSILFKVVNLRHDCVHRNGFDKDGKEITVFTKNFVQEIADHIRDFVDGIEKAVRNH
jgi:hypothetical protein